MQVNHRLYISIAAVAVLVAALLLSPPTKELPTVEPEPLPVSTPVLTVKPTPIITESPAPEDPAITPPAGIAASGSDIILVPVEPATDTDLIPVGPPPASDSDLS